MRGEGLEREASKTLHQIGVPLLISFRFLRKMGCGQIDLAVLSQLGGRKVILLFEVKSQKILSKAQYKRLLLSQNLVSQYLKISSKLFLVNYFDIIRIKRKDFCQRDFTSLS